MGDDARSSIATSTNRTLLATIGLLGCEPRSEVVAPTSIESQPEGEPSGRIGSTSSGPATSEPAKVPASREWCGAIIDTRPRPLLRTSSFLLAWNEVRVADGRAPAGPIPLNEHDARLTICGAPTCEVVAPRLIELNNNAGQISIGTVIRGDAENMLVIPDLSPFFGPTQCAAATQMASQQIGEHLHVTATSQATPYRSHHGYYGHGGYGGCYAASGRHDVVVDVATGMIELEIEHRAEVLGMTVDHEAGGLHVTLTGCNDTLELVWTE